MAVALVQLVAYAYDERSTVGRDPTCASGGGGVAGFSAHTLSFAQHTLPALRKKIIAVNRQRTTWLARVSSHLTEGGAASAHGGGRSWVRLPRLGNTLLQKRRPASALVFTAERRPICARQAPVRPPAAPSLRVECVFYGIP